MKNDSGLENSLQINDQQYLGQFFQAWDKNYADQAREVALFNSELTSKWNQEQRAHFDDALWYMGNFSPYAATKEMVLNNIRDEFGKNGRSHEKLYLDFAKTMG